MDEETKRQVDEIAGQIDCPKDLRCCETGFEDLCRAVDVGMTSYVKCLEEEPRNCVFSIGYADCYYCKCPLRVYVAKNLGK